MKKTADNCKKMRNGLKASSAHASARRWVKMG